MFKKNKIINLALATLIIGLYANSALSMDDNLIGTSATQATPCYVGERDFLKNFENGKYKEFLKSFYGDIECNPGSDKIYPEDYYISSHNKSNKLAPTLSAEDMHSYLLELIQKEKINVAAKVFGDTSHLLPDYYLIQGICYGDASDFYYVKASEVEQALKLKNDASK